MQYKYTTVVLLSGGNRIEYIHHNDVSDIQEMLEILEIDTSNAVYQTYYASEIHITQRYINEDPTRLPF